MRATSTHAAVRLPNLAGTIFALYLLVSLVWLSGCGSSNPYPPGSFDRGYRFYERGNHLQAVNEFETFVRQNPTDSLAARAQYLKATSYLQMKEYPLAVVELQIMRKDYPSSELVEDAYFQEGVAYFEQVGDIGRDISGVYNARQLFAQYLQLYPMGKHAAGAQEYLTDISDIIVRKKLRSADVYRHLGQLDAVSIVLENVLAAETDTRMTDLVLLELGKNYEKLREWMQAAQAYQRIITEYPESSLRKQAEKRLKRVNDKLEQ